MICLIITITSYQRTFGHFSGLFVKKRSSSFEFAYYYCNDLILLNDVIFYCISRDEINNSLALIEKSAMFLVNYT